jgi:hypothetical protein
VARKVRLRLQNERIGKTNLGSVLFCLCWEGGGVSNVLFMIIRLWAELTS